MNENYLTYLTSNLGLYGDYSLTELYSILDDFTHVYKEPDISFLKKEGIKPFKFIEEKPINYQGLEFLNDPDMEYFKLRLIESLRMSNRYFNNNPQQSVSGYDEFH